MPLDLTVHRVQDDNAVIGEDIEHVSHTEAWEEQTQPWLCPSSSYHPPLPRPALWGHMPHRAHTKLQLRCMGCRRAVQVLVKAG